MANKIKAPKLKTPRGTLGFCYLDKPDTEGDYADDKYKADLICDANDPAVKQLEESLKAFAKESFGRLPKNLKLPIRDGDEIAEDKDRPELKGKVIIRAKSKFAVGLADAKTRTNLSAEEAPRAGDEAKLSVTPNTYDLSGKGISLYLNSVLLLERNAGNGDAVADFDDDDFEEVAEGAATEGDDDDDF